MNPIRTALDFLRVLLDAIRYPEEQGGPKLSQEPAASRYRPARSAPSE